MSAHEPFLTRTFRAAATRLILHPLFCEGSLCILRNFARQARVGVAQLAMRVRTLTGNRLLLIS
jgi:hypothetical protein